MRLHGLEIQRSRFDYSVAIAMGIALYSNWYNMHFLNISTFKMAAATANNVSVGEGNIHLAVIIIYLFIHHFNL